MDYMHSQEQQEKRFNNASVLCIMHADAMVHKYKLLYMKCVILQDDDGGIDEEYDDAWVQVHCYSICDVLYCTQQSLIVIN